MTLIPTSPYLGKIVFISTSESKKWRKAIEERRVRAESKLGWSKYVDFPSGDRSRIISNEFYRFEGSREEEEELHRGTPIRLHSNVHSSPWREHEFRNSLSFSLDAYRDPVKEWPPLGFSPNLGGDLEGEGGGQEIEHPDMGCRLRKHPLLETSLYLPVGIVCQDALDRRPRCTRQSHVIAKYRLNEIRSFRLLDPADRVALVFARLWTQLRVIFVKERIERTIRFDSRGYLDLCR